MDACDLNVLQTHGKKTAAWNVFADLQSCAVKSLSVEHVFIFFFMQADLFSKMYKKMLILKTIYMKWDAVSFFIISAGAQSRKLSRLFLLHIYFSCLLFLFFHRLYFLFVMPLPCSSSECLHWLQQMEISQCKVCIDRSACIVSFQWWSVGRTLHWKLWAGR